MPPQDSERSLQPAEGSGSEGIKKKKNSHSSGGLTYKHKLSLAVILMAPDR